MAGHRECRDRKQNAMHRARGFERLIEPGIVLHAQIAAKPEQGTIMESRSCIGHGVAVG